MIEGKRRGYYMNTEAVWLIPYVETRDHRILPSYAFSMCLTQISSCNQSLTHRGVGVLHSLRIRLFFLKQWPSSGLPGERVVNKEPVES